MKNSRIKIILAAVAVLLLIPFIAMQFTEEVAWEATDFLVMGVLLLSVGFLVELAFRTFSKLSYRVFAVAGILIAFLLIWAELAVGVFGSPIAGS